ncbi:MAG: hypothetical protein J7M12_00280 [Candidatus Hydrogenedentes bacterium]|nr:hypothetical protein [Candidatus Hydrogenedentota bacterium]
MASSVKDISERLRTMGPDRILRTTLAIIIALIAVQGIRMLFANISSVQFTKPTITSDKSSVLSRNVPKTFEQYRNMLETGVLGTMPKEKPAPPGPPAPNLFAIMGDKALLGRSADDAKLFAVGDEVSGGEKIVDIGVSEVTLEKDGVTRTIKVFSTSSESLPPATDEKLNQKKPKSHIASRSRSVASTTHIPAKILERLKNSDKPIPRKFVQELKKEGLMPTKEKKRAN